MKRCDNCSNPQPRGNLLVCECNDIICVDCQDAHILSEHTYSSDIGTEEYNGLEDE